MSNGLKDQWVGFEILLEECFQQVGHSQPTRYCRDSTYGQNQRALAMNGIVVTTGGYIDGNSDLGRSLVGTHGQHLRVDW